MNLLKIKEKCLDPQYSCKMPLFCSIVLFKKIDDKDNFIEGICLHLRTIEESFILKSSKFDTFIPDFTNIEENYSGG